MRNSVRRVAGALVLCATSVQFGPALAQSKPSEIKIAIVQFLSGAAAPHDASAVNTAKLLTEQFNAAGGIAGVKLNTIYLDEAGSAADKVAEYRRLVQDEKITIAIGYTSSANCLAVAPVADELKTLTIFHVCANYRLYRQGRLQIRVPHRRACGHPRISPRRSTSWPPSPISRPSPGMNYDYAYGRDSWDVFKRTILKLKPDVQVVGELWTKFLATEYSAEISRLLALKPDVIHTVNWGAGLTSFINQAETRGLFEQSLVMMTTGLLSAGGDPSQGRGLFRPRLSPPVSRSGQERRQPRVSQELQGQVQQHAGLPGDLHGAGVLWAEGRDRKSRQGEERRLADQRGDRRCDGRPRRSTRRAAASSCARIMRRCTRRCGASTSGKTHPELGYPILDQFRVFPAADVVPPEGRKTIEWIESWPTRQ